MIGAPPDGPCTAQQRHFRTLCWRLRAYGAPALTFSTATNRPTTTTECRQVVGDTPSLTLRRQK
jgi:hypothetical protein